MTYFILLLEDYKPQMCCNGRECGCLGLPTNPQFCSGKCFDKHTSSPPKITTI